jgi:hypothetical protein
MEIEKRTCRFYQAVFAGVVIDENRENSFFFIKTFEGIK